jgi:hypothetical protein
VLHIIVQGGRVVSGVSLAYGLLLGDDLAGLIATILILRHGMCSVIVPQCGYRGMCIHVLSFLSCYNVKQCALSHVFINYITVIINVCKYGVCYELLKPTCYVYM